MANISALLKPLAAAAVAVLKGEFDANKAQLVADATKEGGVLVTQVQNEIIAALPKNGILANLESDVVKNAIAKTAQTLVAQIPNAAEFVSAQIDNELAQLETTLSA